MGLGMGEVMVLGVLGVGTLVVLVVAVLFFGWVAAIYNSLVQTRNAADQAWSDIEVDLARRLDLVANLVESVKGYAAHESKTLEAVIAARGRAASAHGPADVSAADGMLTQALRGLLAVVEAYPNLKADTNFMHLQNQLTDTENRIAAARNGYNTVARQYRDACQQFPAVLFAGLFGFQPRAFYDIPDELVERAPQVKF